jgi:N-acetyl-gamma-glutamyl-phosphate reductase
LHKNSQAAITKGMSNLVFIDGAAGTTGLQVADRLASRADLEVLILDETARKQEAARRDAMQAADIAILCLPDEAARAAAQMAEGLSVRLIDASSAHRTAAGWVYGFAELEADRAAEIAAARLVSNPGCYPSGFLALARPLIRAGWLAPSASLNVPAVSGYSGGGKALIEKFESGKAPPAFAYATGLQHKHLPEMTQHCGLDTPPIFMPSVGDFAQGMLVHLPLHKSQFTRPVDASQLHALYAEAYQDQPLISVAGVGAADWLEDGFFAATALAGTDRLEIAVFANASEDQFWLCARLDNLGKGASGAAVQNLNLMLGLPVMAGLSV